MSSDVVVGEALAALRPLLDQVDEDLLVEARDFLTDLAAHDDARLREASRYWRAALGAFLEIQEPQSAVEPRHVLELAALGAERWVDYLEGALASSEDGRNKLPAHPALPHGNQHPLAALRSLLQDLRGALSGDRTAAKALPLRFEEIVSIIPRWTDEA